MDARIQQLKAFFKRYEETFNTSLYSEDPELENTAGAFSDCFLAASPLGVNCGRNDEEFRMAMSQGYEFYKSIGITSMNIVSLETTLLDNFHEMTKIHWRSNFIRKDDSRGNIEFQNFYFTQTLKYEHKIFAYITGDEQAVLKQVGLI